MSKENDFAKFFQEQYQENSRIRIRELETPVDKLPPRSMGTLKSIDGNGDFHVIWDNGMTSILHPGKDSFTVLEPELTTFKLYMPLCAERINTDYGDEEEEFNSLSAYEICKYKNGILAAMVECRMPEETERGLMHWYDEDDTVDRKVKSAVFTVEERNSRLWGVAECRVAGPLAPAEIAVLKDFLSGQASDGWGESFEQREVTIDNDEIYVHLWGCENWDIKTEEEQFGPTLATGLPALCFSTLKSTGELICIKYGESGYYPSDWSTDNPEQNKALADYNNQRLGVTDAQRQAMEVGSMVGWNVPGADPSTYETAPEQVLDSGGMQMGGP